MINRIFESNLKSYIKNNREYKAASKTAHDDLNRIGISTIRPEIGKLYLFEYETPDEDVYDMLPLSLIIDVKPETGNLVGLNFHYLPRLEREFIFNRILNSYYAIVYPYLKGNLIKKATEQHSIKPMNYSMFKEGFKKINFEYAIKQYKLERIAEMKCIGYEHWYIANCHNENYFHGSTLAKIHEFFTRYIKK